MVSHAASPGPCHGLLASCPAAGRQSDSATTAISMRWCPPGRAVVVGVRPEAAPDPPPAGTAAAAGRAASWALASQRRHRRSRRSLIPTSRPPAARWRKAEPHCPFHSPPLIAALARPRAVPAVSGPCVARVARGVHRRNPRPGRTGGRVVRPRRLPTRSATAIMSAQGRRGSPGGALPPCRGGSCCSGTCRQASGAGWARQPVGNDWQ